ncbi:MAG: hypothetical protein EOO24_36725 [Comamonadaceae bacterium]|nr:MAG: hypothetical protein EOO24_36725 [Comamonadaceae bacterium]
MVLLIVAVALGHALLLDLIPAGIDRDPLPLGGRFSARTIVLAPPELPRQPATGAIARRPADEAVRSPEVATAAARPAGRIRSSRQVDPKPQPRRPIAAPAVPEAPKGPEAPSADPASTSTDQGPSQDASSARNMADSPPDAATAAKGSPEAAPPPAELASWEGP